MVILIVAGGKGTRLWPLSTPDYPKQLIDVTGEGLSLIQQAFDRAKQITSVDKIFIATEKSHSHLIKKQIPDLAEDNIFVEPARRGTMPAIITTLSLIARKFGENEIVASMWADHYIKNVDGLKFTLSLAARVAEKYSTIAIIGSEAAYPNTAMGHIKKGESLDDCEDLAHRVTAFKEKPDYTTALKYTESNDYLWNTGMIVTSYKTLKAKLKYTKVDKHWLDNLHSLEGASSQDEISNTFLKFKDEAVDTALNEKIAQEMCVISATYQWVDVGSVGDLQSVSAKDDQSVSINGQKDSIYSLDNHNVYIRNQTDKPLAVVGMDDVAVISTENGILVIKLNESQKVKDAANYFSQQK